MNKNERIFSPDSTYQIIIDKRLLSFFKPYITIFLINLMEFGKLNSDSKGWFCYSHEKQQENAYLTLGQIRSSKKFLNDFEIISIEKKSEVPSREWYKINYENLYKLLND